MLCLNVYGTIKLWFDFLSLQSMLSAIHPPPVSRPHMLPRGNLQMAYRLHLTQSTTELQNMEKNRLSFPLKRKSCLCHLSGSARNVFYDLKICKCFIIMLFCLVIFIRNLLLLQFGYGYCTLQYIVILIILPSSTLPFPDVLINSISISWPWQ